MKTAQVVENTARAMVNRREAIIKGTMGATLLSFFGLSALESLKRGEIIEQTKKELRGDDTYQKMVNQRKETEAKISESQSSLAEIKRNEDLYVEAQAEAKFGAELKKVERYNNLIIDTKWAALIIGATVIVSLFPAFIITLINDLNKPTSQHKNPTTS